MRGHDDHHGPPPRHKHSMSGRPVACPETPIAGASDAERPRPIGAGRRAGVVVCWMHATTIVGMALPAGGCRWCGVHPSRHRRPRWQLHEWLGDVGSHRHRHGRGRADRIWLHQSRAVGSRTRQDLPLPFTSQSSARPSGAAAGRAVTRPSSTSRASSPSRHAVTASTSSSRSSTRRSSYNEPRGIVPNSSGSRLGSTPICLLLIAPVRQDRCPRQ